MSIRRIVLLVGLVACGPAGDRSGAAPGRTPDTASPPYAESAAVAAESREKVKVLFFGTSLTAGYGLDPADAYPRIVEELAGEDGVAIEAINAGLSGETSAGALRRIEWALRRPVDVIVIETGGNDALRALDPDTLEANLRAVVSAAKKVQPEATVVLVAMEAPPNLGVRYTTRFREAYAAAARAEGVRLVPFLLEGVGGVIELNQADGVHPNAAGAKVVAGNIWPGIRGVVRERKGER